MATVNNNNFSDYNRPRTNLNDIIPSVVRSKLATTINDNLFNRYLTKSEYKFVDGIVGALNPASTIAQIVEPNDFLQKHQLQPVAYERFGTIDYFLGFQDFIRKLETLGVDTPSFDQWGSAVQFNWVPPVDLDKIINYRNYYWNPTSFDDAPQYFTIKNECNWAGSRFLQIKKSIAKVTPSFQIINIDTIHNIISVAQNSASSFFIGEKLVVIDSNSNYNLFTITNVTFNAGALRTDITVAETVNTSLVSFNITYLPIISVDTVNDAITLEGDLHLLFTSGYVFSTINSPSQPTIYWNTVSSTFDGTTGTTTVSVAETILESVANVIFDWTLVDLTPVVSLADNEAGTVCDNDSTTFIQNWVDYDIGELIWNKNYDIVEGQTHGITILSTNIFEDNSGINFINDGVKVNDTLIIVYSSGEIVQYPITTVNANTLVVSPNTRFFNNTNLNYSIVRQQLFNSLILSTAPSNPTLYQFWVDSSNDSLNQWNGSNWVVLQNRVSLVYNLPKNRYSIDTQQTDPWSQQNEWVNRNEISNFVGLIQAQIPIIEFNPYLSLSQTSFVTKQWQYRPNTTSSYINTTVQPTLFELLNIQMQSVINPDFAFETSSIIILNEKYGNLTDTLVKDTQIALAGFLINNGTYTVDHSDYLQLTPNSRFVTRIFLTTPVKNTSDAPENATIAPLKTSLGDLYLSTAAAQWFFVGISNEEASSITPVVNPMLNIAVSSFSNNSTATINPNLDSIIGLVWQEFKFNIPTSVVGAMYSLDASLQDLALYKEYQMGDVRVYIDGQRQYGNFIELRSTIDPNFVSGIKFDSAVVVTSANVVRVELGEYALTDIGKRAVLIPTSEGTELFNLVDIRKVEQVKSDVNQYPEFNIFDINGNAQQASSTIFEFATGSNFNIDPNTLTRIAYDATTKDYTFKQFLIGPQKQLYLYEDFQQVGNELQSIWKIGSNNEYYVPQKLPDGTWDLPNTWYYNLEHANDATVNLSQLFPHFNTIVSAQNSPSVFSVTGSSLFYLDDNINYGLGGTIHEYNNGLDLLISALMVNNVNSINLIQFAHDQYQNDLNYLQNQLQVNAANYLAFNTNINNLSDLATYISSQLKESFEKNEKFDEWFGDSTTFNPTTITGIQNWIATIPYVGLGPKYQPYFVEDDTLGIVEVHHHDGHRSEVGYSLATKTGIYKALQSVAIVATQLVTSDSTAFPSSINGNTVANGNYLVRTNTVTKITKLYRYNTVGVWEWVNLDVILAEALVGIEQNLYNNLPASADVSNFNPTYNTNLNKAKPLYSTSLQEQFSNYVQINNVPTPFSAVNIFQSNNPFTWNYAFTPVPVDPVTGQQFTEVFASWQALYTSVYGTPYPHREPWVLQGYPEKPTWWDDTYRDSTNTRYWLIVMWDNILNGIIPVGQKTPIGTTGTGQAGQITTIYNFVSVNVDNNTTLDGILPDGLLPPFWDTSNTTNSKVRSLYDPRLQQFITTPQANYAYGQEGPAEWQWLVSSQYLYDQLVIAFKLDPIRFTSLSFGTEFTNVNCLQVDSSTQQVFSHKDTIFHGDFIGDTNKVFLSSGLNQWYVHYNRYNGFSDVNSGFKTLWTNWTNQLTYLFSAFIDTGSFTISNDTFDVSTSDYQILEKQTQGINDIWIDALLGTVLSVPSKFDTNRNFGIGWSVQFTNTSPIGHNIQYYAPEDYCFRAIPNTVTPSFSGNTFRFYSYNLDNVGIQNSFAYVIVSYNQNIIGATQTQLTNTGFEYWFRASVDGGPLKTYKIAGENAQTFTALVDQINTVLSGATASIQNGNIVIASNTTGSGSSIEIIDDGLFVSANPNFFNTVSSQIISPITFLNYFILNGNQTGVFSANSECVVTNSTNFNGTYNITSVTYDTNAQQTTITVKQSLTLLNLVVDGIIEPVVAKTIPPTWKNGTQVYLNTTGILPSGLDDTTAYYVVILNDREFQLSALQSQSTALIPSGITVGSAGSGNQFVGRVQSTFTALSGLTTNVSWRRHYSDTRYLNNVAPPIVISGIQYMIDFIKGYSDYLTTLGFVFQSQNGENVDPTYDRVNDWQFETEKFINSLYTIQTVKTAPSLQYQVTPIVNGSYFSLNNNYTINWGLGTQVVLSAAVDSQLPTVFNNTFTAFVPYYVIPSLQRNRFQLALSLNDARMGNAIKFNDTGFGNIFVTIYNAVVNFPVLEINPFKSYIWVNNDEGILADLFAGLTQDVITNQRIYDNNGNEMTNQELVVFRQDKQSRISLTLKQQNVNTNVPTEAIYMRGMHLFFNGYENALLFNDYSSDNFLIYDPFFGLNTPRFYLTFNRQPVITYRPNVGGFVLQNNDLVPNFEASADNLRRLYDIYNDSKQVKTIQQLYNSFGYDGVKSYLTDLNISPLSQFIFWKGMIHAKGSNNAIAAFLNQQVFDNIVLDEFWAYKLAEFGDSKQKNYLDLRLYVEDVENQDLRLEFVLPDDEALDDTFKSIRLTDLTRWFDQPDAFNAMSPYETFYFDVVVQEMITNAETKLITIDGKLALPLTTFALGTVITYFDATTATTIPLSPNADYTLLNCKVIIFNDIIRTISNVTVYSLSYNYNAQNPAKVIDTKSNNANIANLIIWNPAFQQYYYGGIGVVDIKGNTDPAHYTNPIVGNPNIPVPAPSFWNSPQVGEVWFDDSKEGYLPYFDAQIYPNIDDQLSNWGLLADWASITLYQWTQSTIPPSEWNATVSKQANDNTIAQNDKLTGSVYTVLYQDLNFGQSDENPNWVQIVDSTYDVIAGLIPSTPVTLPLSTLNPNYVNIYVNGITVATNLNIGIGLDAVDTLTNYILNLPSQSYVHVILPAIQSANPSQQLTTGLSSGQYKQDTPYSTITQIDPNSTQPFNLYYFWVTGKTNTIPFNTNTNTNTITIFEAQNILNNMNAPYMIITGFRGIDFGYGLIYGNVFDENSFNVPYRFSQCIARGLAGLITDENRFALEFTRDFTLRDKLPTGSMLNVKHTEWALFRQNQISKIDTHLWDKLVEALVKFTIVDRTLTTNAIPSLNRILYDNLYNADTRFGLEDDQVFTDATLSLGTVNAILTSSNVDFGEINIDQFLQTFTFDSPSNILTAMYYIYDNFPTSTVNYMYFQLLHDSFSLKQKYKEIFKTSWVSIQVAQNILPSKNTVIPTPTLATGGPCFTDQLISSTPSGLNATLEYILTSGADNSINYLSYDSVTLTQLRFDLPNRAFGAGTITDVWTDGTYVYISSQNGGMDVYYFNGVNFVYVSGILTTGTALRISGYNPVLIASDNGDGLGVYLFNGINFILIGTSSQLGVTDVRDITIHNNYIITCGFSRVDAWKVVGNTLTLINSITTIIGGDDITRVISDGFFIYTGSNNNVKIQVFTFNGTTFNQIYTDQILTSGPTVAVGNGYFFTTGSDIRAYKFNGSTLALIDIADNGATTVDINYSQNTQRLYASNVGIYDFSKGQFNKIHDGSITSNKITGSFIIGLEVLALPQPSQTPTPTVTPSRTITITPTQTPTHGASLTPTMTVTPTMTPSATLTATATRTPTPSTTPSNTLTPTFTPTMTRTANITPTASPSLTPSVSGTVTITPTITLSNTPTNTPSRTPTLTVTPTLTATASITPSMTRTPTLTATASVTPTSSVTPSVTSTVSPSITASVTPTLTGTATPTPTPTAVITSTVTPTLTPTNTTTNTPTNTITPTRTQTATPSVTPTATATITPTAPITPTLTATSTVTPSVTPTSSVTNTPTTTVTQTVTPTITPTLTATSTVTPTFTPTRTATVTPTFTPTTTPTNTITPTNTPTITPTNTPTITPTSSVTPSVTQTFTPTITPTITPTLTRSVPSPITRVYNIDGTTGNETIPSGYSNVLIEVWGAGGGGGSFLSGFGGGGGGGGGYVRSSYSVIGSGGLTMAIRVGNHGFSGGGNGSLTTVSSGTFSITTLTGNGGAGAANATSSGPGAGGTGGTSTGGNQANTTGGAGAVGNTGAGAVGGTTAADVVPGNPGYSPVPAGNGGRGSPSTTTIAQQGNSGVIVFYYT